MASRLATDMTAPALAFLWDHRVAGHALFAAAAMIEMAVAGSHAVLEDRAGRMPALEQVSFSRPVVLKEMTSRYQHPSLVHGARSLRHGFDKSLRCAAWHFLPLTA